MGHWIEQLGTSFEWGEGRERWVESNMPKFSNNLLFLGSGCLGPSLPGMRMVLVAVVMMLVGA